MRKPKSLNPEVGDKIEIIHNKKTDIGILLDTHDAGVVLLKLSNGYNIGIKRDDVTEIKILEKRLEESKDDKEFKISGKKPLIDFIITGGTISSKLDPKTGGVKDLTNPKEFFSTYPEIFEFADVRIHSPFMKWSENMTPEDWIKIAKIVEKSLKNPEVKGIIISHGTDTLHFTGAALSFMLRDLNKPVVLTYSQRSSDRGSADSRLNLICAARAALTDISEVMLVGHATTNDDYCYCLSGTKTRKMHSSRRDTFRPINTIPLAKIWPDGKLEILSDFKKRNKNNAYIDAVFENKVALVKFYPGQDPDILEYYRKKGYKGLIVEFVGLGQVANQGEHNWIPILKEIISKGIYVFAVPQTIYGRVDPYVYESARRIHSAGVVYLDDILPETAFVKLGWVLAHKDWRGTLVTPEKMKENIAGEFNPRLNEEFLN